MEKGYQKSKLNLIYSFFAVIGVLFFVAFFALTQVLVSGISKIGKSNQTHKIVATATYNKELLCVTPNADLKGSENKYRELYVTCAGFF